MIWIILTVVYLTTYLLAGVAISVRYLRTGRINTFALFWRSDVVETVLFWPFKLASDVSRLMTDKIVKIAKVQK